MRLPYTEGSPNSKICLIGEAPGEVEELKGLPFVGPAGELLTKLLRSIGVGRNECYFTNVIKERPPYNDISKFIKFSKTGASTTPEYNAYERLLYEELSGINANVIVPLGNVALYALTRKRGINKWRGSILEGVSSRKVIPTIHPSACLRAERYVASRDSTVSSGGMYLYRYYIMHDLLRARKHSDTPELGLPERRYIIKPSLKASLSYMESILNEGKEVGFDIEVINGELSCFSLAKTAYEGICIPFTMGGVEYFDPDEELAIMRRLEQVLSNPDICKIGQNIIFDSTFMFRKYGIITVNMDDTMIAQAIITPEFPKALDFIASIYSLMPYYKDDGKKWENVGVSDEQFWAYNIKDSMVVMEVFPQIVSDLKRQGNYETYKRQSGILPALLYMQERGLKVDMDKFRDRASNLELEIAELQTELNRLAGYEVNPNSPKQLQELFYMIRGYQPYTKRTKQGSSITTDETAMKRLIRKGCIEAGIVLEIRHKTKLRSTYFEESKIDDDGRLRGAFKPVGTVNGRLSSEETIFGTGNNLQNQVEDIDKCLIADEGCLLLELDLSQAENRIVAYISPEPTMMSAFEKGEDIHSKTASMIFGIPTDEIIQMDKEKVKAPIGDGNHTHRYWGKKANHGFDYGEGYKKFSLINELPESEGKFIHDMYHRIYPGIRAGQELVRTQLYNNRTLTNCYGRKRTFMEQWGDSLFNSAYNFIPQSTVADKINLEGITYMLLHEEFDLVELLNQKHDALVLQMPLAFGWDFMTKRIIMLRNSLEAPIKWHNTAFIIPVGLKIGLNLYDKKTVDISLDNAIAGNLSKVYSEVTGE